MYIANHVCIQSKRNYCTVVSLKQNGIPPASLAAVLRSPQWKAYTTAEDKIYYVNVATQGKQRSNSR